MERIRLEYQNTLGLKSNLSRPELWDGHTAERIIKLLTAEDKMTRNTVKPVEYDLL